MANIQGESKAFHSFIGGLVGSYLLIKLRTDMSINRQVGYYLSARVLEGIILLLIKKNVMPNILSFESTYSILWALVMFLYMLDESILNKSLTSSMHFIYD